ncbi:MAG: P1 family peptidase [Chloroflexota bacterium]|nr:P1 family peptidase [Chloroflexota bacterium]
MSAGGNRLGVRLESGPLGALTDVPGIAVGHFTHDRVLRGISAILAEDGAVAGVSVRGSNPGTINTDALAATTVGGVVHAIGLTGGSLFGLQAVTGITDWLVQRGIGHRLRGAIVPVVAGAVIFDLAFSDPSVCPSPEWGRGAADAATRGRFARGNVGAGAGGTAGKGPGCVRTKGGLGTASLLLPGGIVVGAMVVINSLGGLIHPLTGELYATSGGFDVPLLYHQPDREPEVTASLANTTLGVIATNAELTKPQVIKIAELAHDGLARAIRPSHAMLDGDTVFALSTADQPVQVPGTTGANMTDLVGHAAADAMVLAVLDAARETAGVGDWPSVVDAGDAVRAGRQEGGPNEQ